MLAAVVGVNRRHELADADANLAQRLKDRLKGAMETTGRLKLATERFSLSVAQNGGKQPLDVRCGVEDLPSWAVKRETVVTVDRDAIRLRLDSGESLDFASLMERGTRISIR